jgi:hypothetical protein
MAWHFWFVDQLEMHDEARLRRRGKRRGGIGSMCMCMRVPGDVSKALKSLWMGCCLRPVNHQALQIRLRDVVKVNSGSRGNGFMGVVYLVLLSTYPLILFTPSNARAGTRVRVAILFPSSQPRPLHPNPIRVARNYRLVTKTIQPSSPNDSRYRTC